MDLSGIDIAVFIAYCCVIIVIGLYVSHRKRDRKKVFQSYNYVAKEYN